MGPRSPNHTFPAKKKSTISKAHSAVNSLFHRLSGYNDSSCDSIPRRAERQNRMPKHTNGPNVVASHNGHPLSDNKQRDSRSSNSLDYSHGPTEQSPSPTARLAATSRSLQRLADLAKFLESSFSYDVDTVEGACEIEMEQEKEIRRLTTSLETLTYVKSEELGNLRQENTKLKAEQDACTKERDRCKTMQVELEARQAAAEASRNEVHKRNLQDEKAKFQKHTKAQIAEIEDESKRKVRELHKQIEKLSATNERLNTQVATTNEKLETKKTRHARERTALEHENAKLTLELKQLKSEFPVQMQPVQYYVEKFRQISDAVKAISSKYFEKLPESASVNPEAVHRELSKLNPIFESTPISHTEVSKFLRVRNIQHIISNCLCKFIWQPYFPGNSLSVHQVAKPFLNAVSSSLSGFGGRSESIWRILTLRAIDVLGASSSNPSHVKSTAHRILEIVRPLTNQSELAKLEKDLIDLVENSATLWKFAQIDEVRIVVEKNTGLDDKDKWHAEYDGAFEEAPMPPAGTVDTTGIKPLCLFPNVLQIIRQGETMILHPGRALFADSHVFIRGVLEKKELEEELAKAIMDARLKVNARRTSLSSGPNSPMERRFSNS